MSEGKILCATRGGEASVRTQEAVIERAKETGDTLIFFYVSDVEFLAYANYAMRSDVVLEEMERMGQFLMTMAVERAARQGVEARSIVRQGNFAEQLKATIEEEGITLVVLGLPTDEDSVFKLAELKALADSIREETGAEVWIPGLDEA